MIGVLAATKTLAQGIIDDLGLTNARPIGLRAGGRGTALDGLIIHWSALPLKPSVRDALFPCLTCRPGPPGRVYELHDPIT